MCLCRVGAECLDRYNFTMLPLAVPRCNIMKFILRRSLEKNIKINSQNMTRVGPYPFFVVWREQMSRFARTAEKTRILYIGALMQAQANEIIITCACAPSTWEYPRILTKFVMLFYFSSYAFMVRCTSRRQFASLTSSRCFIKRIKYRKRRRAENPWIAFYAC